ncbi:MAG: iron ABC transporter permease [Anaerolineae bacterium]|nr:iron ABC transporter permease [Anaerolineae bacterium]
MSTLRRRPLLALSLLLLAGIMLSIFLGRYPHPGFISPRTLLEDRMAQQLVLRLRLPRILMACLLGMSLAAAGTVLQMIFRNPLVEPGFLGVSQGAAFGAAFSIIFLKAAPLLIQLSAALFACLGLAFSYFLARHIRYGGWTLRLVLAGIAVSAIFSSGVGLLKYVADPLTELPEITFWMLGALWGITWNDIWVTLPVVTVALTIIILMRWRLNLLSLNEATAISLGISPTRERLILLVAAVVATASVVSLAGVVGWVGLIVPHLARRLLGADAQHSLPGSVLLGGLFTLLCDNVARTALPGEIPLGVLTSLIGAGIFIVLMLKVEPTTR